MRSELEIKVAEYLASGKQITNLEAGDSREKTYPIRRTRRAQINFLRKRDYTANNTH